MISLSNVKTQNISASIISEFMIMNEITNKITIERQFNNAKVTCVSISDDLLFVANSVG